MSQDLPAPSRLRRLIQNKGARKHAVNAGSLVAERAVFAAVNLVVGVFVARYLGPVDFGQYTYLISIVTVFAAVSKLGLDGILVRELLVRPDDRSLDLGSAFWMMCLSSIILSLVVLSVMAVIGTAPQMILYMALALSLVMLQPFTVVDMAFQADVKAGIPAVSRVVVMLIGATLKILAIKSGAPLQVFFVIMAVEQAVLIAFYLIAAQLFHVPRFLSAFSIDRARELFRSAWPMLVNAIAVAINIRITQILVAVLMDDHAAGVFAAASRLYEAWIYVPFVCVLAVSPALVNARIQDRSLYETRLVILIQCILGMSFCVFLFFALFGETFINLTFGPAYAASYVPLVTLMLATLPAALGTIIGRYFVFEHREGAVAVRTILAAVLNIVICVVLIPIWGERGAALSVLFSLIGAQYIFLWFRPKDAEILGLIHQAVFPFQKGVRRD